MTEPQPPAEGSATEPWIEVTTSRHFAGWLADNQVSVAFTTYQVGKVFFLGRSSATQTSVFERTYNRCMGLWGDGQTLWMSSLYQIWHFENVLQPGNLHNGYDRVYVPRVGYTTGDLDIHDLVVEASGRLVFANTHFGCLATMHERDSFLPLWLPPFLSRLSPEDRCHLNGIAMVDGRVRYVTVVSTTDILDGWRDHRRDGGCVIDVSTNEIIARGLSMPHSPRFYRGRLWLLNSGTGHLGSLNANGVFKPLTFCPGYLRGLAFVGDFALVGLSQPRHNRTFTGLALDDTLKAIGVAPRCGIYVIDLRTGDVVEWVQIQGLVRELYDVVVLPGVARPMAFGFKTEEIQRILTVGPLGKL